MTQKPSRSAAAPVARTAFTLVEMLVVMGIIGILLSISVPALISLSSSNRSTQAIIQVTETFERARDFAISRRTYVWVAFCNPDSSGNRPAAVAMIASGDGTLGGVSLTQASPSPKYAVPNAAGLMLADKIQLLKNCFLQSEIPSGNTLEARLPGIPPNSSSASDGPVFTITGGAYPNFVSAMSVMFTPTGEAKVSSSISEALQVVVIPTRGAESNPVKNNVAASAVRVYGLTGRVKVYQP